MKRIVTLLLAAGLVFSATAPAAEASEFKISGKYIISGQANRALGFMNSEAMGLTGYDGDPNGFNVYQRVQIDMQFIASENLSATLRLRAPNKGIWGDAGGNVGKDSGMALGAGGVNVSVHHAYLDYYIPGTEISIRLGLQPILFPLNFFDSNPVMDENAAGITVDVPFNENIALIAQWFRPFTAPGTERTTMDVFALQLPMFFDGIDITPWAAYAMAGRNSEFTKAGNSANVNGFDNTFMTSGLNAYWLGLSTNFTLFDPFQFGLDAIYSDARADVLEGAAAQKTRGWIVDGYLAYKTDYGTPALFAWYGSGDDHDAATDGRGRVAEISGGFGQGTSSYFDNSMYGILPSSDVTTPAGTWGIGFQYSGFTPIDKVTMGGHVMYVQGTNNSNNAVFNAFKPSYLTTKDSFVELGFHTRYEMYKEFQIAYELNYMVQNFDRDTWFDPATSDATNAKFTNGWRTGVSFLYNF